LRKPRKPLTIVVHAFSQTAQGKRGSPVGEQLQLKFGMSRKEAKSQRSEKNDENHLGEYFSSPFQTWRLCALAGGISESESLRLSEYLRPVVHYDKHVGFSFRIVVRREQLSTNAKGEKIRKI
jgi:hypothetical protein